MSRVKEVTVFKFDELDDTAKEKAREWFREGNLDYDWWDSIYEDAKTVGEILGITITPRGKHGVTIWFNGFYHQGSGSSFGGSYCYAKGSVQKIKEYAPQDEELHRIATDLRDIQKVNFFALEASIEPSNRESSIRVSVEDGRDSYRDISSGAEEAITEAMNDFNSWIYHQLEREYEWLNADEQVDGNIEANEYEFEIDGSIA